MLKYSVMSLTTSDLSKNRTDAERTKQWKKNITQSANNCNHYTTPMQPWFSNWGQTCEPALFPVTVKELEEPSQESSRKSNFVYAKQLITGQKCDREKNWTPHL